MTVFLRQVFTGIIFKFYVFLLHLRLRTLEHERLTVTPLTSFDCRAGLSLSNDPSADRQ